MCKISDTIGTLIENAVIPSIGIFQIEENQIQTYIKTYNSLFGQGVGLRSSGNRTYARKMAGLNLLKLNFHRNARFTDIKSGMIYLLENPVFPDHYKIGMTIDLDQRLSAYQTCDPYRRYKIIKYEFVLDRVLLEKELLCHPHIINEEGEWIKRINAIETFSKVISYNHRYNVFNRS